MISNPATASWRAILLDKIGELELIASWASQVGYGAVRDHCRMAIAELREKIDIMDAT
jgi:hypothetical protein